MKEFWFRFSEFVATSRRRILSLINRFLFYLSLTALGIIFYEYGFSENMQELPWVYTLEVICLTLFGIVQILRVFFREKINRLIDPALGVLGLIIIVINLFFSKSIENLLPFFTNYVQHILIDIFIFFVFVIELGTMVSGARKLMLNPALIYMFSFLGLIALGTALLLLPNATNEKISFLDALFTSTSSVCVTGLVTVDTASLFSPLGKGILIFLIQLGGLGVMTFTTFFGYFFQGSSSLENQFFMKSFLNEDNVGKVFTTLGRVVFVTLGIEIAGGFFIYFTVPEDTFIKMGMLDEGKQLFFCIFHSISAFCNAGFSTLPDGLFNTHVRSNYNFQLVISVLVIFGGLGFPVMFNYIRLISHRFSRIFNRVFRKRRIAHIPRIININSKIATYTTVILLIVGFILYFILEKDHTLAEKDLWGKIVTSIFGSVTPRTAGFNTVPLQSGGGMAGLSMPTILLYFLLMWIGASPGSTGGGIKTTTFSLGVLNVLSLAKQKSRTEILKRQISNNSIRRAFAVMFMSVLFIGLSGFLLSIFEASKDFTPYQLLFEAFSAYGTVGLTLGVTGGLSSAGKIVIICCMFMGRVGALTIFVSLIKNTPSQSYQYPEENITIT